MENKKTQQATLPQNQSLQCLIVGQSLGPSVHNKRISAGKWESTEQKLWGGWRWVGVGGGELETVIKIERNRVGMEHCYSKVMGKDHCIYFSWQIRVLHFLMLWSEGLVLWWTCNLSKVYPTVFTVNAENRHQLPTTLERRKESVGLDGCRLGFIVSFACSRFLVSFKILFSFTSTLHYNP